MSAMISMMISSGSIMPAASRAGMTSVSSGTPITPRLATSPDLDRPTRNTASAATRRKVVSGMDQGLGERKDAHSAVNPQRCQAVRSRRAPSLVAFVFVRVLALEALELGEHRFRLAVGIVVLLGLGRDL